MNARQISVLLLCWPLGVASAFAQAAAAPSATATLALSGLSGQHLSFTVNALEAMPQQTVQVRNAHTDANETYQGVELASLLAQIDAPLGAKLRSKALSIYIIAEGSDHYRAVYSLAEVDPAFHNGMVIVADRENGQPLDTRSGPFKLVNTEDKRPARWVRNLVSLRLETAAEASPTH